MVYINNVLLRQMNEAIQRRKDKHLFLNVQIFWRKYFVLTQNWGYFCKQTLTFEHNY